MLSLHLERLSDIALADQDVAFVQPPMARQQLKGRIELREVRFRYSPTDPYVLNGINLLVEPGEHFAITGPSGGGKSTLIKIILGLLEPESGEVLIDGIPLRQFGYANFREQVGAVLQDDHLFAGSIADNIALFDDSPDFQRVVSAAAAAAIHEDIARMPMGYETLVGDMGSSLSGGQKQRIFLARALYRQPRLLVMDEATSHLDNASESEVLGALSSVGITRIVGAHRSAAIESADKLILVANGRAELATSAAQDLEHVMAPAVSMSTGGATVREE